MNLEQMQIDHEKWALKNFGRAFTAHTQFLGMVEELGELAHAVLKGRQGIRGTPEEHEAAAKDAVGDLLIFLMGYCTARGWSAEKILVDTWSEVSKRDFTRYPKNGVSE